MSKPTLVSIVALDGRNEAALLALAAAAARGLEPAIGRAILDSAHEREVAMASADSVRSDTGAGAVASIDGHTVVVGTAALFADLGLSLDSFGEWPARLQRRGQEVLFVAVDGRTAGFLGVSGSLGNETAGAASSEQTPVEKEDTMRSSRVSRRTGLMGALAMAAGLWTVGCDTEARTAAPATAPTVGVVTAEHRSIALERTFTGRVEAPRTVELRPRVSGALVAVRFREGTAVHQGAPLFQIDPRPFAIALRRAEADAATVGAQLGHAREELERAERLAAADAVAVEELERRRAEVGTLEARRDAALAAVQDAALHLEFTTVLAPIDGRIGRAEVTAGNLVNGGNGDGTRLAVLYSMDPVYVYFDLDPTTAADAAAHPPSAWSAAVSPLDGRAALSGPIDFVDNAVGPQTGTLRIRARIPNPDGALLPGSVVRVLFRYGTDDAVTVVPELAIGTDQGARYVLVAADGTVKYRPVSLGSKAGVWRVVHDGVRAGERVVLPGTPGLRPGMRVETVEEVVR